MTQGKSDLPKLARPAKRALAAAGITRLEQLSAMSEAEVLKLHGMGPATISTLQLALEAKGLSFRTGNK